MNDVEETVSLLISVNNRIVSGAVDLILKALEALSGHSANGWAQEQTSRFAKLRADISKHVDGIGSKGEVSMKKLREDGSQIGVVTVDRDDLVKMEKALKERDTTFSVLQNSDGSCNILFKAPDYDVMENALKAVGIKEFGIKQEDIAACQAVANTADKTVDEALEDVLPVVEPDYDLDHEQALDYLYSEDEAIPEPEEAPEETLDETPEETQSENIEQNEDVEVTPQQATDSIPDISQEGENSDSQSLNDDAQHSLRSPAETETESVDSPEKQTQTTPVVENMTPVQAHVTLSQDGEHFKMNWKRGIDGEMRAQEGIYDVQARADGSWKVSSAGEKIASGVAANAALSGAMIAGACAARDIAHKETLSQGIEFQKSINPTQAVGVGDKTQAAKSPNKNINKKNTIANWGAEAKAHVAKQNKQKPDKPAPTKNKGIKH